MAQEIDEINLEYLVVPESKKVLKTTKVKPTVTGVNHSDKRAVKESHWKKLGQSE